MYLCDSGCLDRSGDLLHMYLCDSGCLDRSGIFYTYIFVIQGVSIGAGSFTHVSLWFRVSRSERDLLHMYLCDSGCLDRSGIFYTCIFVIQSVSIGASSFTHVSLWFRVSRSERDLLHVSLWFRVSRSERDLLHIYICDSGCLDRSGICRITSGGRRHRTFPLTLPGSASPRSLWATQGRYSWSHVPIHPQFRGKCCFCFSIPFFSRYKSNKHNSSILIFAVALVTI